MPDESNKKLNRLHMFEVEDLELCPNWLRNSITAMICVVHRWFGIPSIIAGQIRELSESKSGPISIIDLCSGSGGPMLETMDLLSGDQGDNNLTKRYSLTLTDIRPSAHAIELIETEQLSNVSYCQEPVDATNFCSSNLPQAKHETGSTPIRTLICGFHHLRPELARQVLSSAQESREPLLIFELTDGTVPPKWLWWAPLLPNFLFGLVVSLSVRPFTFSRFVFTFIIPIIPICFAWDGAISGVRAYNKADVEQLISELPSDREYEWNFCTKKGKFATHSMIIGRPAEANKTGGK